MVLFLVLCVVDQSELALGKGVKIRVVVVIVEQNGCALERAIDAVISNNEVVTF